MIRLSSNWTLILRLFIPVAWIAFFTAFLSGTFLADPIEVPQIANPTFRTGLIMFILGGLIFFAFTFFRLRRVDADQEFVYISDYFRTYRYTFESIDRFRIYDHLFFKAIHVVLKEKGRLGKRAIFLPKMIHFDRFIKEAGLLDLVMDPSRSKE